MPREQEISVKVNVIPEIGEVRRVSLGPHDRLVVMVPEKITVQQRGQLRDRCAAVFGPDYPVLILDGGMDLAVIDDA
jgi:hypothetical protein